VTCVCGHEAEAHEEDLPEPWGRGRCHAQPDDFGSRIAAHPECQCPAFLELGPTEAGE
jgi:hypothetical protein